MQHDDQRRGTAATGKPVAAAGSIDIEELCTLLPLPKPAANLTGSPRTQTGGEQLWRPCGHKVAVVPQGLKSAAGSFPQNAIVLRRGRLRPPRADRRWQPQQVGDQSGRCRGYWRSLTRSRFVPGRCELRESVRPVV